MSRVEHDSWTVTRQFAHPVERVFAAWATPEVKVCWFDLSDAGLDCWQIDFRSGGHERFRSPAGVSPSVAYDHEYRDIVDLARIVGTYAISVDGRCSVAAVSTVEFAATAGGTQLRCTQQTAHLDGLSAPGDQRDGLGRQLDRLAQFLD